MAFGELIGLAIVIGLPAAFLIYIARRFFTLKEKQLESETRLAAEKAAQYAASNEKLEQRLRVLEQIVTDRGAQTASQIEALRSPGRLTKEEESQ